ncbi:hypothetical protein EDB89DRAFT_1952012 [Lactarius sanguifluus]|nr:hypothetical protein EDB89DRAFT_1952012 [Lactarius sanguifluus]
MYATRYSRQLRPQEFPWNFRGLVVSVTFPLPCFPRHFTAWIVLSMHYHRAIVDTMRCAHVVAFVPVVVGVNDGTWVVSASNDVIDR